MTKETKDIKIVPIFNQGFPGIWDDFLRIRVLATQAKYNYKIPDADIARYRKEYQKDWSGNNRYCVAYAAFDGQKMVGFVRSVTSGTQARIECLYVLPEYQGANIGHNLLKAAESSLAPVAKTATLTAMGNSDKFYQKNGYKVVDGVNICSKPLKLPVCQRVPIFAYNPAIARRCKPVMPTKPDCSVLIGSHFPLWASFDYQGNVNGILCANPDNNKVFLLSTNDPTPQQLTKRWLQNSYQNYLDVLSAYTGIER